MCDEDDESVIFGTGHASQLTNRRGKPSLPLGLQHAQDRANRPQTRKKAPRPQNRTVGPKKGIPARPAKKKS